MTSHSQVRCICGTLIGALALALNPRVRTQTKSGTPTIRIPARLVNINAVVTDSQGNLVKSLTRDHFTVLDGGQPQQISFFSAVDNEKAFPVIRHPGPDTYTNRPADYGAAPSVAILLFDILNSRWESQGFGLRRIREFLRHLAPQDHLGIYVLGDDLKVVHDFTRDASDLVQAIHRYDENHSHSPPRPASEGDDSTGDPALDRFLSGKDNQYRLATEMQATVAYLEAIARQLSSIAGRKTLIWVTDSIGPMCYFDGGDLQESLQFKPASRRRTTTSCVVGNGGAKLPSAPPWLNSPDLERMVRLMNGSGISVYTVDARGLETQDLDFGNPSPLAHITSPTQPMEDLLGKVPKPNPDLLELAGRTGGRAFFNRNDLETGVRRALDDSRFTYQLAYYPDHNRWQNEWRKIEIKVSDPGLTVLARNGYFAFPDPRPIPQKDRFQFFDQIAASPIESTALLLSVHLAASRSEQGSGIDAQVHLDPLPMLTRQDNDHRTATFEVMFMQLGAKNKLLDATNKDVTVDLNPGEYESIIKKGWDVTARLKFMPGATLLCVILHDKSSDAVGSVRIPLVAYTPTSQRTESPR